LGPWAQTEEGARRAAVAYLEATEQVVTMPPADAAAYMRSISTRANGPDVWASLEATVEAIQARTSDPWTIAVAPALIRSSEWSGGWDVSIWYATVIWLHGQAINEYWSTSTVTLAWEDETWKIDGIATLDGPVPGRTAKVSTTPVAEADDALDQFANLDVTS
jgi:hypothetical protein